LGDLIGGAARRVRRYTFFGGVDVVEFEVRGNVAVISINRPEARNAVNGAVASGIEAAIDRLEEDENLWVGVLTGKGPVFCAGADLKAINSGQAADLATKKGGFAGFVARERIKPVIAAIDGPALAGGCEISLACDMIVASREARFGVPEVKRSLAAAAGALFRLPKVLPRNVATWMITTGEPISAEECARYGMVNVLAEPGQAVDEAVKLAELICQNAPLAVRESLKVMKEMALADDATAFRRSNEAMMSLAATEDFWEGPKAFIEKRPPVWKGK
jgi:enoyl-CoA hydratase